MKPSKKYFHDDNSSSATTSTSYWNNINIIKWNRESLEKTINYIDRRLLYRIIAACLMIALIALFVSSSTTSSTSIHQNKSNLNNSNDTENTERRQRLLVNINMAINNISSSNEDSIIDTTTKISIFEVTASQQSNSVLPLLTTNNIIDPQNSDSSKKSNDEVTLTKNYVSLIMQFI